MDDRLAGAALAAVGGLCLVGVQQGAPFDYFFRPFGTSAGTCGVLVLVDTWIGLRTRLDNRLLDENRTFFVLVLSTAAALNPAISPDIRGFRALAASLVGFVIAASIGVYMLHDRAEGDQQALASSTE